MFQQTEPQENIESQQTHTKFSLEGGLSHKITKEEVFSLWELACRKFLKYVLFAWIILPHVMILEYVISYFVSGFTSDIAKLEALYAKNFYILGLVTFLIAFLISIVYFIRARRLKEKKHVWILLLLIVLLWSCVCTIFSGHFVEEINGSAYLNDGLESYFIYASVFACAFLIRDKKIIIKLLRIFSFLGNITAILILLQNAKTEIVTNIIPFVKSGTFFNSNHCGYYLTMTITCLIGLYLYSKSSIDKILLSLSLALQFYSLLINDTFGCFIAVVVATVIIYLLFILRKEKRNLVIAIPAAVIICVSLLCGNIILNNFSVLGKDVNAISNDIDSAESNKAGSGRMILWKYAIEKIGERPILGYGPEGLYCSQNDNVKIIDKLITADGTVKYNQPKYSAAVRRGRPHNEYLQYAAFLGIPGLLLYLAALIFIIFDRLKHLKSYSKLSLILLGMFGGYLVSAIFGVTMYCTTPYFFMIFGLLSNREVEEQTSVIKIDNVSD